MEFRILGPVEVRDDGRLVRLGGGKQRAVLAVLLLHVGELVPAERLVELLWGDTAPRTALHSIQIYVSELRKEIKNAGKRGGMGPGPDGEEKILDYWREDPLAGHGDVEAESQRDRPAAQVSGGVGHPADRPATGLR